MPISIDDVALISKKDLAKLTSTVEDLLSSLQALGGDAAPKKAKRGRPRKKSANGRRRPRKAGKKAARKAASGKRAPRGALESEIKKALRGRKEVRLVDVRNKVMKSSHFSKHDPKTLYTMILTKINLMSEVKKSGKGYTLKG